MFTIRPAIHADAPAIAALWHAANRARHDALGLPVGPFAGADPAAGRRRVIECLADPRCCVVLAEDRGDPVAMAIAVPGLARDGASSEVIPGLAHVTMVAVHPDRWGQGLGSAVLEAVLAGARERGFTRAQLWTHETNLRAQRLYLRLGWTASGRTTRDDYGELIRQYVRSLTDPPGPLSG